MTIFVIFLLISLGASTIQSKPVDKKIKVKVAKDCSKLPSKTAEQRIRIIECKTRKLSRQSKSVETLVKELDKRLSIKLSSVLPVSLEESSRKP